MLSSGKLQKLLQTTKPLRYLHKSPRFHQTIHNSEAGLRLPAFFSFLRLVYLPFKCSLYPGSQALSSFEAYTSLVLRSRGDSPPSALTWMSSGLCCVSSGVLLVCCAHAQDHVSLVRRLSKTRRQFGSEKLKSIHLLTQGTVLLLLYANL